MITDNVTTLQTRDVLQFALADLSEIAAADEVNGARGRDVGGVEVGVGVGQQHGLHPPRAQHLLAEAAAQHGHAPVCESTAVARHRGRPPLGPAAPCPGYQRPRFFLSV